tara:strand:+ start:441 stop:746 length:306 start_codon:yes stop_codon:yes gene_type:complete
MRFYKYLFFILFFLNSCQSVQDGLTGKKRSETNDEFFVIKKNPLAMPPDYEKLPKPIDEDTSSNNNEEDIKELLSDKINDNDENLTSNSSLENSILEKINE